MKTTQIVETTASGDEIKAIVELLEPALIGTQRTHGIMACISMSLILMEPDLTPDQLQEGVRKVSEYICLFLEGTGLPEMVEQPKVTLN